MTNLIVSRQAQLHWSRVAPLVSLCSVVVAAILIQAGIWAWQDSQRATEQSLSATYRIFPTLDALRKESVAVIVGRAAGPGTTELLGRPGPHGQAPTTAPPVAPVSDAVAKGGRTLAEPPPTVAPVGASDSGVPVTTYTLEVTEVLSGSLRPGQTITVKQIGGTVAAFAGQSRRVEDHHDPPLVPGDSQVLFLGQNADGSHFIVGGPQGRLRVSNRRVFPLDRTLPATRSHYGQPLADFGAAVRSPAMH